MAKGKKRESEKKNGPKSPGKPGAKEGSKDKKHCHAFDFGKGTCRFGAKCRYLHEKGGSSAKAESFSPEQKKLITTLLSSAMKRTAAAIAKKNKQKEKKPIPSLINRFEIVTRNLLQSTAYLPSRSR